MTAILSSDGETASIPLMGRRNTIRAYAIVDVADAPWAVQWRWNLTNNGYAGRDAYEGNWRDGNRRTVLMHRELLDLSPGDGFEGDHRDLDRLNNRRKNLRKLSEDGRPNTQNKSSHRGSTSQHRGVSWRSGIGKWVAQVQVNGKSIYQRTFDTEQEAADAARAVRLSHMPYALD